AAEGYKEISTLTDSENAYFHYQVTDQNGKKHITTQTVVTYEVTNNGAKPITVDGRTVAAFGGKISFSRTTNAQGHDVVVVDGNGESTVT
ncbi:hypothetical protein, partial [Pseudoalteromonas sp. SIMBA_162]|uniref:hypothetical protein n=1 Tax=Pseudoalteromonas sp. SIMBA_162 TaxID=3080867 RepID=UPI00397ACB90